MFDIERKEMEWGGKTLSLETGRIGRQASSVIVRYGNTVVMCNVTIAKKATTGIDFVPLTVSYIEKFYSTVYAFQSQYQCFHSVILFFFF